VNEVLTEIIERVNDAAREPTGFLDVLFGAHKEEALAGTPVVLFGAGVMGGELCSTLRNHGVEPVCFCDNDNSKSGTVYRGAPVISFDELKKEHELSFIVIATKTHSSEISHQLLTNGFKRDRIINNEFDVALSTYIRDGSQGDIQMLNSYGGCTELIDILIANQDRVKRAYNVLADQKSKDLLISRLVFMSSHEKLRPLQDFMLSFSEPILQFGIVPWKESPENYLYFNNDVFSVSNDEILVDVGAFDGDTVETFVQTCWNNGINYKHIYAFEPDPDNYRELTTNAKKYANISCHQLGLWSGSKKFRFLSSDRAMIKTSSSISETGDVEIETVSLDSFLRGKAVTFIKMDPGGSAIPEAIKGASQTIAEFKPKLAIGAYHSFESIFEIPLLVESICPQYNLYLRHHSWCINETDLLAVAS
jgi:FkbM family methyltransferase